MKIWNGRSGYSGKRGHGLRNALLLLAILALMGFTALQVVIGTHSRDLIRGEPQLMVVFGCKVDEHGPSIMLQDRLDTAYDYLSARPEMTAVLSGGRGNDEHVSEAQAMYDYLTGRGIEGDRLLMEGESHNTWENVKFTRELLEAEGYDTAGDVLLVSSGFHLARIELLWTRGVAGEETISTLAAPVNHIPSAIHMFFREPLALVKSYILDQ